MEPVPPKHGRWKYMFMQLCDPIPSSERGKEGGAWRRTHCAHVSTAAAFHNILKSTDRWVEGRRRRSVRVEECGKEGPWEGEEKRNDVPYFSGTLDHFCIPLACVRCRDKAPESRHFSSRPPFAHACVWENAGVWSRDVPSSPRSSAWSASASNLISQRCHKSQDFRL